MCRHTPKPIEMDHPESVEESRESQDVGKAPDWAWSFKEQSRVITACLQNHWPQVKHYYHVIIRRFGEAKEST